MNNNCHYITSFKLNPSRTAPNLRVIAGLHNKKHPEDTQTAMIQKIVMVGNLLYYKLLKLLQTNYKIINNELLIGINNEIVTNNNEYLKTHNQFFFHLNFYIDY